MRHYAITRVSTRAPIGLLAAITALATLLAACGGGGENPTPGGTPTGTPMATPVGTPTVTALPAGTPVISGNRFEYPARGYGVEIPEGWEADANYISGPGLAVDAFFPPEPEQGGVKANISVTVQSIEAGLTAASYLDQRLELIRQLSQDEPRVSQREVGGVEATVVEYSPRTANVSVEKTDVIFVQGTYGWTITLTVPAGQRASYEGTFEGFLASYHAVEQ
jgi:hypothetical protein